jgi:hypothetical protein
MHRGAQQRMERRRPDESGRRSQEWLRHIRDGALGVIFKGVWTGMHECLRQGHTPGAAAATSLLTSANFSKFLLNRPLRSRAALS